MVWHFLGECSSCESILLKGNGGSNILKEKKKDLYLVPWIQGHRKQSVHERNSLKSQLKNLSTSYKQLHAGFRQLHDQYTSCSGSHLEVPIVSHIQGFKFPFFEPTSCRLDFSLSDLQFLLCKMEIIVFSLFQVVL